MNLTEKYPELKPQIEKAVNDYTKISPKEFFCVSQDPVWEIGFYNDSLAGFFFSTL